MNVWDEIKKEIFNTQVVILAGGLGKRMGLNTPKPLIKVCGKSLLERCIEFHKSNGFYEFVLLVGYGHQKIIDAVKRMNFDVKIDFSLDPKVEKVGKGKALKNALLNGKIQKKKRALISYPDDVFIDKTLPLRLLLHHVEGVRTKGIKATVVFTTATDYPFGVGEVNEEGIVKNFEEKPVINLYTNTGMLIIEPEVYELIEEMVDIESEEAVEFEKLILPELASRKQLYSMIIPKNVWFPVNTQKELEFVEKILSVQDK